MILYYNKETNTFDYLNYNCRKSFKTLRDLYLHFKK